MIKISLKMRWPLLLQSVQIQHIDLCAENIAVGFCAEILKHSALTKKQPSLKPGHSLA